MLKLQTGAVALASIVTLVALAGCSSVDPEEAAAPSETSAQGGDGTVITYNSPAEWGNFGAVLPAFNEAKGINAPNDPKNSGQTLAALQAEAGAPVADVAYVGIAYGQQLVDAGVLQPYAPAGTDEISEDLRDGEDNWVTVHTGTVAFIVNSEKLGDAPTPTSWEDLLDPAYNVMVGYLDPTQAAVGYSVSTAVNEALGGSLDDWAPGLDYLSKLKANGATVSAQTATAKVAQGEIPILIDTDFNGYKLRDEGVDVEVVIPEEGSVQIPYIVGLVNGAPNADNGKQLLDYYFSEEGQGLFAAGYMRPAVGETPADIADKTLPAEDYERAKTIDYIKQGAV